MGATLVPTTENLREAVEQVQFAVAGIEMIGHSMQAVVVGRAGLAQLQLHCTSAFWGTFAGTMSASAAEKTLHLRAYEAQWLAQPARAITGIEKGEVFEFLVTMCWARLL